MEKIVRQTLLFDFYGELLTDHQQRIYEDVVCNDMSCSEVAAERGVSRQGVHDLIRRVDKQLDEYENKLRLVEKFLDIQSEVKRIRDTAADIKTTESDVIVGICDNILKEL